jgi:hypothetical protein
VNKLIAALALLALTGCAICQKHETACFVTATLVAGAIVASQAGHHTRTTGVDGRDVTILPLDCAQVSCK